jgi:hypothetical protein
MTDFPSSATIIGSAVATTGPIDSRTRGYLIPQSPSPPLEGADLLAFVQNWVSGISGLDGAMVRPRWQPEPPNIPTDGIAWASIGIMDRPSDTYPVLRHFCDNEVQGLGHDELQRHEFLEVLCSFYDLGSTGMADFYAAQARDGAIVPQNRESLFLNGFQMAYSGDITPVPSLTKMRWLYRVDWPVTLRRCITRTYPIRNLVSLDLTITRSDGVVEIAKEFP